MKFKIGDIVTHILSKEKFIIIEIKDDPVFAEYICRHQKNREWRTEKFYEFELQKIKK